ncbi:MAG TPA: rhodanese-like domain-containing protein [Candidatus Didemnitutus sp.]|nr:rhodanese-like domain-containing protein [Candidatus Didemnitutus sp.]
MKFLLTTAVLLFLYSASVDAGSFGDVTTQKASSMISSKKGLLILDVRTPEEFAKGHLERARLMNYYEKSFMEQLKTLPRDRTLLIYCKSGRRSAETLTRLKTLGFKSAYNMLGGFDAWSKEKRRSTK